MEWCQYLKEQLNEDYKLLKQLEDARRCETNPRRKLGLNDDIEEIEQRIRDRETELKSLGNNQNNSIDIDTLVQQVRQQRHDKIQNQCGTMPMLDISQPIAISDIYTDVNILEEITSQQWLDSSDLARNFNPQSDNFDRLGLGRVRQKSVPGLDAVSRYNKLMVLGKPGSGKTTFLQWVAIKCNLGEFQPNRVPIFIRLKNFAEDAKTLGTQRMVPLQDYINEEFVSCGITDKSVVETILTQGKALILLDGLDEVLEEDDDEVIKYIRRFVEKYFKNMFIITCRIAARKYRFLREGFTNVEVADFSFEQVEAFAKNWFVAATRNHHKDGQNKANKFIDAFYLPKNKHIQELARTPILLNLACLVFQSNDDFPSKHSRLYEQALSILLQKWDECRWIKRDQLSRHLSLLEKRKLLNHVAFITFARGDYFFEQDKIQQIIANYLLNLPPKKNGTQFSKQDSDRVLKSIEAQHGLLIERSRGVYSFSHLSFQEYFTAQAIVEDSESAALSNLVNHITEKRWHEVFMLVSNKLNNADKLLQLMKQKIDAVVASDDKLQQFILREKQIGCSTPSFAKATALRSQYLEYLLYENIDFSPTGMSDVAQAFDLTRTLNPDFDKLFNLSLDPALDVDEVIEQSLEVNLKFIENFYSDKIRDAIYLLNPNLDHEQVLYIQREIIENLLYDARIKGIEKAKLIQEFNTQLPTYNQREWLIDHGQAWTDNLRNLLISNSSISQEWQFSKEQINLLQKYRDGNLLLVNCLNNSEVSPEVRQEIEDTLLLPITEIEKRRNKSEWKNS
ncbi:NACHT domain-containing protein [Coleofasciculus sp. E1-EBD-02]|uniref:NACHT domain-containing protein n=1 Tax=Coleofasciculus sp. E1-EBD-02 TaxID=3068481 RepID=UPI0032F21919